MNHHKGEQRVVNGQLEQDCIECGASRTTANGNKQFVMYGPWTIKECEPTTLSEMWTSPKLINTDAIDKIPPDLIERLLQL